jgi:hypothetical protein
MLFNHTFATRRKFGVINTDDNASGPNLDDRVERNSGFVPRLVNLNYAPTALHAFAAGQEPIPQADFPSIRSNLIATSFSVIDGFSNRDGDLVTHAVYSPPDNGLAIGDNGYIISVVNDTIGWTPNFSTDMQFEAFSQFFPASLVGKMSFTDPQALYDPSHGKFIVTEELYKSNSPQSKILIAVSHDAQPTGNPKDWDFFSINSQYKFNGKPTAADYPQSDIDGENLFIASDQFGGNKYFGSVITKISLSDIENGPAGSISYSQFMADTLTPIYETLDVAGSPGKGAFFVGYDGYSENGYEYVTIGYYDESTAQLTSPFPTVYVGKIDNLEVTTLVATEPNGDLLDASDRRINDVKVIGNDLFAVTEVVPPNLPNSLPNVHWFDFDISNPTDPVLKAQGDVPGTLIGAGVTTFNGSIIGDARGDLLLNFTATGPSLPPGDFFAIHRSTDSTDPTNFWEEPIQYASSPTSYSDGGKISRWGDYSSAVVDPTHPHTFLISNEYAVRVLSDEDAVDASRWGTSIADVSLDSSSNAVNPTPAEMLLVSTATTSNTSGFVDGSIALLTQHMAAGFQGGFDNGSGGYTASPTPEAIFGEAPLLTKPTT